ncbi:MAG: hypothetical protein WC764_00550 [Candidatus Paceibacterota bacterium]|jgi:hypothetical protein
MKTYSISIPGDGAPATREFALASKTHPIYCVATGKEAELFCDEVVHAGDAEFATFNEKHSAKLDIFRSANSALGQIVTAAPAMPNTGISAGFMVLADKVCSFTTIGAVDFYHYNAQGEKAFQAAHPFGYQLANGAEESEKYLISDKCELVGRDMVFLATDGFKPYFELPEFTKLFLDWPENLDVLLKAFMKIKSAEDSSRFGRPRTLVAVKL